MKNTTFPGLLLSMALSAALVGCSSTSTTGNGPMASSSSRDTRIEATGTPSTAITVNGETTFITAPARDSETPPIYASPARASDQAQSRTAATTSHKSKTTTTRTAKTKAKH